MLSNAKKWKGITSIERSVLKYCRVNKLQRQVESVEERRNQRLLEMHRRRVAMEAHREKSLATVSLFLRVSLIISSGSDANKRI